ncbi:MBOAT family O-acyltransferase [Pedobacter hartonius]|uniref:D-alanyl-lipoteichoic acid acyltransferase DltB, MBOAT superfamily n=1 Tax=Pedobacter hartonius TaxID=425514 RepID=A0A1H4FPW6_9SPHI|nr:MBOAT family O-acyltransferase [Pedobacter hartonius]SEA99325.1 D-alanyl-lipoteichoic acid acyltransferase DltB, MBOAT superfamily [Pedobacter hartonius]
MIFNSLSFLLFFTGFFFLYWFVFNRNLKLQNILLLVGSYIFYAVADWRFLALLVGISVINFILGIGIERSQRYRKILLWAGMVQGIGGLIFFKYFNFFISSFDSLFAGLNLNIDLHLLNILIPVGISFFTFRTLSYLQDIYKGKTKATANWINFFTYVAFFPCILSGPIDKAKIFIPQLEKPRLFDYNLASDGLRQILCGLFKKMVIADNCSMVTNEIFGNYQNLPGSSLLIAAFLYSIQIYADFSGYSDIAIGVSKLLGFKITRNFDYPYFSQNIAEFWRKWHISLTSWLTEYVFSPLNIAFRDWGKVGVSLAIVINFTIVGIWHGANWTYVLFGFIHGCFFIPLIIKDTINKKKKIAKGRPFPSLSELNNVALTCGFVMLTFIIFRSDNISDAFHYYKIMFSGSLFSNPVVLHQDELLISIVFLLLMFIVEWVQREREHALQIDAIKSPLLRLTIYFGMIACVILMSATTANQFIYFKF